MKIPKMYFLSKEPFDIERVESISNSADYDELEELDDEIRSRFSRMTYSSMTIKPDGGLWLSPQVSKHHTTWTKFMKHELDEKVKDNHVLTEVILSVNAKVYTIDKLEDAIEIRSIGNPLIWDWEEVSKRYDAIYMTENGQYETRLPSISRSSFRTSDELSLYGWDIECMLILNKDCIERWEEVLFHRKKKYE